MLRLSGGSEEQEAILTDKQDQLWDQLAPEEQEAARAQSWRAWPDQYFLHSGEFEGVEQDVWHHRDRPPRTSQRAA